jgi:hypothetical protein
VRRNGREAREVQPTFKRPTKTVPNSSVPTFHWGHYLLTAQQARLWANELLTGANLAEASWNMEEQARESKVGK